MSYRFVFFIIFHIVAITTSIPVFACENMVGVNVSSSYIDLKDNEQKRIYGVGNIVEVKNKGHYHYFVLTSAHLSQGDNLRINIGEKNLTILGRLANNRYDAEIIEVEKPDSRFVLASYQIEESSVILNENCLRNSSMFNGFISMGKNQWINVPKGLDKALKNQKNPSLPFFETDTWLSWNPYRREWTSNNAIYYGVSGSALIEKRFNSSMQALYYVKAIASRFVESADRSYFSGIENYTILIQNYIANLNNTTSGIHVEDIKFYMKDGRTFRKYGAEMAEFKSGGSSDGGNIINANSDKVIEIDTNYRTHFSQQQESEVLALKLTPKSATLGDQNGYVFADPSVLDFQRIHKNDFEFHAIYKTENLISILKEKLGLSREADRLNVKFPRGAGSISINFRENDKALSFVDITVEYGNELFQIDGLDKDRLSFTLDQNGILMPSGKQFDPIITVLSNTGRKYQIDLSSFFFSSLLNVKFATALQESELREMMNLQRVYENSLQTYLRIWPLNSSLVLQIPLSKVTL